MIETKRYQIRDPRPTREANPWSFYMPCEARQNAVSVGDHAQVIFENEEGQAERMWVAITEATNDRLIGNLDNNPAFLAMKHGEEVEFERFAIIDIITKRPDDPEETNVSDDRVFHRCWVDPRILNKEDRPGRATNGHTQPEGYDGGPMNFPWGGWMIVGERWEEGDDLTIGTPVGVFRCDAGIAEHILGDDVPTVVEKIDGQWKSRAA